MAEFNDASRLQFPWDEGAKKNLPWDDDKQKQRFVEPDPGERILPEAGEHLMKRDPGQPMKPQPARGETMTAAIMEHPTGDTVSELMASMFSKRSADPRACGPIAQAAQRLPGAPAGLALRIMKRLGSRDEAGERLLVDEVRALEAGR